MNHQSRPHRLNHQNYQKKKLKKDLRTLKKNLKALKVFRLVLYLLQLYSVVLLHPQHQIKKHIKHIPLNFDIYTVLIYLSIREENVLERTIREPEIKNVSVLLVAVITNNDKPTHNPILFLRSLPTGFFC